MANEKKAGSPGGKQSTGKSSNYWKDRNDADAELVTSKEKYPKAKDYINKERFGPDMQQSAYDASPDPSKHMKDQVSRIKRGASQVHATNVKTELNSALSTSRARRAGAKGAVAGVAAGIAAPYVVKGVSNMLGIKPTPPPPADKLSVPKAKPANISQMLGMKKAK